MMRSCVSVPVLSVHKTSIAPKFWIAWRRFTITRFFDMAIAPLARFTVTIIGSISGVNPTATATANKSASSQSPLVRPLIRSTAGTMTSMNRIISQVKRLMPLSKLVSCALPGDLVGELAKIGFRACMHDDAGAKSADNAAAHEAEVWQVEGIGDLARCRHAPTSPTASPRRSGPTG